MAKDNVFAKPTHDGGVIGHMIQSIANRSTALRNDCHIAAVSCIMHATKHGDVMYAQRLIEAMGEGWRLNALRAWFGKFGPFTWVAKTKDKAGHFGLDKDKRKLMLAELEADEDAVGKKLSEVTYWEFKPETEFMGFDLLKEIKKLIKRASTVKEDEGKAEHPDTKIDPAILAKLQTLAETKGAALN